MLTVYLLHRSFTQDRSNEMLRIIYDLSFFEKSNTPHHHYLDRGLKGRRMNFHHRYLTGFFPSFVVR